MSAKIIPFPTAATRRDAITEASVGLVKERTALQRARSRAITIASVSLIRELSALNRAGIQHPDWEAHVDATMERALGFPLPKIETYLMP